MMAAERFCSVIPARSRGAPRAGVQAGAGYHYERRRIGHRHRSRRATEYRAPQWVRRCPSASGEKNESRAARATKGMYDGLQPREKPQHRREHARAQRDAINLAAFGRPGKKLPRSPLSPRPHRAGAQRRRHPARGNAPPRRTSSPWWIFPCRSNRSGRGTNMINRPTNLFLTQIGQQAAANGRARGW